MRLDEPYKVHKTKYIDSYRDNFPSTPYLPLSEARSTCCRQQREERRESIVPPRIAISQWATTGTIRSTAATGDSFRASNIIGKPLIIYWSYETTTDRLADPCFNPDHIIDLVKNFLSKTRWRRTLQTDPWLPVPAVNRHPKAGRNPNL